MIGSFHESTIGSRHFSTSSTDSNIRNIIDENSSYDDLVKVRIIIFIIQLSSKENLLSL